jgi:hypothetical protein
MSIALLHTVQKTSSQLVFASMSFTFIVQQTPVMPTSSSLSFVATGGAKADAADTPPEPQTGTSPEAAASSGGAEADAADTPPEPQTGGAEADAADTPPDAAGFFMAAFSYFARFTTPEAFRFACFFSNGLEGVDSFAGVLARFLFPRSRIANKDFNNLALAFSHDLYKIGLCWLGPEMTFSK